MMSEFNSPYLFNNNLIHNVRITKFDYNFAVKEKILNRQDAIFPLNKFNSNKVHT